MGKTFEQLVDEANKAEDERKSKVVNAIIELQDLLGDELDAYLKLHKQKMFLKNVSESLISSNKRISPIKGAVVEGVLGKNITGFTPAAATRFFETATLDVDSDLMKLYTTHQDLKCIEDKLMNLRVRTIHYYLEDFFLKGTL